MDHPVVLSDKIEQIFGSRPRDGTQESTLWHKRGKIETRLTQLLAARSQNICIDGPTGSGKSSLALTALSQSGQSYIWVPVVNGMGWPDFCEDIIVRAAIGAGEMIAPRPRDLIVQVDKKKKVSGDEVVNPLKLLERIKFDFKSENSEVAALRKTAREWRISDVEGYLADTGCCLLIDDFEKAPDQLVQTVADLCKRLTTRPVPKCLIIGTGETFARLYRADIGLDGRLAELPLASFGTPLEVWNYLNDGLERLGFDNPRAMLISKLIPKSEADEVRRAFYEAADGMPKYINELALRICERVLGESNVAPGKVRVSVRDALNESHKMLAENVSRSNQQVRGVERYLRSSIEIRAVLRAIFRLGANNVHHVDELVSNIERDQDPQFSYDQLMAGLEDLKKLGLYVQTGKSGEVVFAKEPMFAHVLGLMCADPQRFNKDPNVFGLLGQRTLPLAV